MELLEKFASFWKAYEGFSPLHLVADRLGLQSSFLPHSAVTLLEALLVVYIVALLWWNTWIRLPGEPPIYRSFLPWIGHGAALSGDVDRFFAKARAKNGDVFVVTLAGSRAVLVTDPFAIKSISRSVALSFDVVTQAVRTAAHGLAPEDFYKIDPKVRKGLEVSHLSGTHLRELTTRAVNAFRNAPNVRAYLRSCAEKIPGGTQYDEQSSPKGSSGGDLLEPLRPGGAGVERGLLKGSSSSSSCCCTVDFYALCSRMQFDVLTECLLGAAIPNGFNDYATCRSLFELAVLNLPGGSLLLHQYFSNRNRLREAILEIGSRMGTSASSPPRGVPADGRYSPETQQGSEGTAASSFCSAFYRRYLYHTEVGVKDPLFVSVFDALFTGLSMSIPPTFWLIARIVADGELRQDIQDEIHRVLHSKNKTFYDITLIDIDDMVILDATLKEVFRYYSTAPMARICTEPSTIESCGKKYSIRKGDWVMVHPKFALHWNENIYTNPQVFQKNRFRRDPRTNEVPSFRHNSGRPLSSSLLPFGDGRYMCPGRLIAATASKLCSVYLLVHLDIQVPDGGNAFSLPEPKFRGTEGFPHPVAPFYVTISPR